MPLGEIYVKLVVGFPRDPKVRALARLGTDAGLARDLYVQMLLYCKENLTDGFVPAAGGPRTTGAVGGGEVPRSWQEFIFSRLNPRRPPLVIQGSTVPWPHP